MPESQTTPWPHASDEPIEIIISNECTAQLGLSTSRFRRLANEIEQLRAENKDLRCSVIAFGGPWMVRYAKEHGLPEMHLHPDHYDILKRAGARMDDFVRGEVNDGR